MQTTTTPAFRRLIPAITLTLILTSSNLHSQDVQRRITISFTEPFETSNVASAEQGIVKKILVREGQVVKQGEVLAVIDDSVLQESLRLAEARASSKARVRAAKAMLGIAEMQKQNFESLMEDGHANPSEVNQVNAEYESAVAEMELANDQAIENQIELDRIKAQIQQRKIVSPMDAVVKEIHHRKGEYISVNDPKFATVVQLDRLRARFYLHLDDIEELQVGKVVSVLIGKQRKSHQAKVEFVSPVIDPDSGTARVDLVIENPQMKIRSGIVCRWPESPTTAVRRSQRNIK